MPDGAFTHRQAYGSHIKELRKRLFYCLAVLVAASTLGWVLQDSLLDFIRAPLGAHLYYTSPIGGLNALIKIAISFGLLVTIPFAVYHTGRFLTPAFKEGKLIKPLRMAVAAFTLALVGAGFGYYASLPAALHFLTTINSDNLQPFIIINDYLNFVFAYLVGYAILFQLPLIVLFVNKIKPQKPGKLMKYQKYVLLFSFIAAAILTPTPDPVNQTIMAAPIIVLYQFSVLTVWFVNRRHKAAPVDADSHVRQPLPDLAAETPALAVTPKPVFQPRPAAPAVTARPISAQSPRPRLIMDIAATSPMTVRRTTAIEQSVSTPAPPPMFRLSKDPYFL